MDISSMMQNVIFSGAEGACANIQIDNELDKNVLERILASNRAIISTSQYDIGGSL